MKSAQASLLNSLKAEPLQAMSLIRPMIGCSRPFLAEANDGFLYIVKTYGNHLHPNQLANEFLGSTLCAAVGLPVAPWRQIELSTTFLRSYNPVALYDGYVHRPGPGLHYASRLVEPAQGGAFNIECLPGSMVNFVRNRPDFLGMYLLDVCAMHRDNRQAIFAKENHSPASRATFIDHGHMFGGSKWDTKSPLRNPCHSVIALYRGLWTRKDVNSWIKTFHEKLPDAVNCALKYLPSEWYTGDLTSLKVWLNHRIKSLPTLVDGELERTSIFREHVDATMHVQGVRVCQIGT